MGKTARLNAARKGGPDDATVAFGYVHPDQVSVLFHTSFLQTVLYDKATSNRIVGGAAKFSSANISNARNDVVREFLAMPSRPDWLWMVDTDMEWAPDAVERLLQSAYDDDGTIKAHVVGGLCFGVHDGQLWPTLYALDYDEGELGVFRYNDYPRPERADEDCMFQVAATGAAFLLIHRSVLEQMAEREFNKTYPWFQEMELQGKPCGEDFTFCLRAGQLEHPVWVNTAVRIGHHKSYVLKESMFLEQRGNPRDIETEGVA